MRNRCSTVLVACLYLMYKYKWSLKQSLEYVNTRKSDIDVTKANIKSLKMVESAVFGEVAQSKCCAEVRLRNDWDIEQLNHSFADGLLHNCSFNRLAKKMTFDE